MSLLEEWRQHPYKDSVLLLVFIVLSGGGVRWLSRPSVILTVDGTTRKLHPKAHTVGEVLAQQHITLGPEDMITPPLQTTLERNTNVHLTRVTHTKEVRFAREDPKLTDRVQLKANLRPVLVEVGYTQESSQTVRSTFYDGVKTVEEVLKRKTVKRPIYRLTLFDKSGQPAKTYDLTKARKLVMRATGYYVGEKYVPSDTTYLGFKLRRGLVAVDPKVIPLRSRLYVKGYGYAYAADTGSAIKGNRIDLAVKGKYEEQKFNRQQMTVYVLEKSRSW